MLQKELQERRNGDHLFNNTLDQVANIILNIGCGATEAALFSAAGAERYIGLDFSARAARYGYSAIKRLGTGGVTACAAAESLPIRDGAVDCVYSNGVLHHTPETGAALTEIHRVLKPGGKGVIGLYATYSPQFIRERIKGYVKLLTNGKYQHWYSSGEASWEQNGTTNPWTKTYSKRELVNLFSKHGFVDTSFTKTGFQWADVAGAVGRRADGTHFGKNAATLLSSLAGGMWAIVFTKR
jgi:ubiquinone/menaquinone biosynthesis C-methylase UbiE